MRAGRPDATYNYAAVPANISERVGWIAGICHRHGVLLPTAALQFPLAHPVVTCVIPGARSAAETASHWQMLKAEIPTAFWNDLRASGLLHRAAPTPGAAP